MRQFLLSFITLTFVVLAATCITTWIEGVTRAVMGKSFRPGIGMPYLLAGFAFMFLAAVSVGFKLNVFVQSIFPGL